MKITRRQLIELGYVLLNAETLFKAPITGKFYYAVAKNREIAREEYKLYMEANPYPPQRDEYEAKRDAIKNEVGESVKKGFSDLDVQQRNAILTSPDPKVMPPETRELLITRLNELADQNKDLLDEIKAVDQRRDEFLDEVDDFAIKTVKLSEVPDVVGGNGYDIMYKLDPMIIDED